MTKASTSTVNAIGISGGRTLTVNDDLTVSTSSSSTSNELQIWAGNWADDSFNLKFDPSSTLHVKGNINVFNLNENTGLSPEDHVFLVNLANTTVDGNVNLKSHAIYIKTTDSEGKEHISRSNGYNVVMFHGNSTIGKDLNVDKAYFSVSRYPEKINTKEDIEYADGTGITTVNGNATFTDEGELTVAYGHLNVKGNLTFDNGKFNLSSEVRDGDGNIVQTGQDASINVGGDLTMSGVSDNRQIIYNEVSGNSTSLNVAGDVNLSGTSNIHAYDNSELNFEKDLNIESTEVRDIFCVSEGAVGNIKGDMKVAGTTEDGHQNYYDMRNSGTLNVAGNISFEGTNSLHVFDKSELNVGKNATFNEGEFSVTDSSNAKIDGDLTLNHVADTNIWNKASEGSSITVGGNLSLSGLYKEGTGDFTTSAGGDEYHRNRLFASGEGSSITVKGNTTVANNAELFAETYSNPIDSPDHEKYIDKTTFKDLGRATFEGDVNLSTNAKLGSYNAGVVTVEGNVNAQTGGNLQAWDSDATLTVKGDAKFTGSDSRIQAGRTASIAILGNTSLQDGSIELDNKGALSVGNNLNTDNSSLQVKDSTLTVNGNYEGVNTALNANGKSAVNVDKDLLVSGKIETITGAFDGASLKVGGSATVSDLVRFSADRNAAIEIGQDLNLNSTLSDASYSTRESAGIYNKSSMKVGGDVNVLSDSLLKADFDSSIEIDGDLNVKVDSHRNEIVGAYNNSSIKVKGSLNADRSSTFKENADINSGMNSTLEIAGNAKLTGNSRFNIFDKSKVNVGGSLDFSRDAGNDVWTNLSANSSLNVEGDLTSDKSSLSAYEKSSVNVGKNLTLTNTVDENHEIYLENSSLNVNGDVTLKGLYKDHAYTTDEDTAGTYYRNKIFTSGVDASYKIGGDLNLLDNSNFGLETASNVPGDDPSDTIIKDNFEKVATGLVAGNVNVKNNSRFGVYQSAEATVNGDITATNGGIVSSFNSGAALTVKGDVNVTDKLSRLETGNIGSIDVGGKVAVENGATAYIGKKGTITASKGFSVNNATLEIENGKLVLSGEDAVLDLTQGGVLKTNEAGSINLSKGASVESLKETLLSDDTKTTAAGVAEKTFEADALSKVHLTNLGEVTLDEAQRLHGVLFNSETGILDLKIVTVNFSAHCKVKNHFLEFSQAQ